MIWEKNTIDPAERVTAGMTVEYQPAVSYFQNVNLVNPQVTMIPYHMMIFQAMVKLLVVLTILAGMLVVQTL